VNEDFHECIYVGYLKIKIEMVDVLYYAYEHGMLRRTNSYVLVEGHQLSKFCDLTGYDEYIRVFPFLFLIFLIIIILM
jgi:hypothetical protein